MDRFKNHRIKLLLFLVIVAIALSLQYKDILFSPTSINIIKGENKNFDISFPFSLEYEEKGNIVKTIFNEGDKHFKKSYNINAIDAGEANFKLKILGLIPVKDYSVNVVNRPELTPGGNSIGVRLNTKGVLVVAVTEVIGTDGIKSSPARDAGLKVGDSIVELNGIKIESAEQVVEILNQIQNENIEIVVLRNKGEFKTFATPIQCIQDNSFRLGIWVRDKTTGIGTLTYYDEENNSFGALGHGIIDVDTKKLLTVEKGMIVKAKVSNIELGQKGIPGEIRGVFYRSDDVLGEININNEFGIYGSLTNRDENLNDLKPIPIGFKEEVENGEAYILTTLDDNKIEKFKIEITKIETQDRPDQKSMVIKITDPKLLQKTGGIVQGMSGSPIIQNDRLIGAVTHVFLNDPTKGYGIYIEWMLEGKDKP